MINCNIIYAYIHNIVYAIHPYHGIYYVSLAAVPAWIPLPAHRKTNTAPT